MRSIHSARGFLTKAPKRSSVILEAILAGAFFPFRRAVPVDGGYRITGQTPFVSSAHQAAWFFGLANVFDDDEKAPRLGETENR